LPPKPAYICTFEQKITNKVHKDLVLRKQPPTPDAAACPSTQCSTLTTLVPPLTARVASALAKTNLGLSLPSEMVDDDVIITGKKHKLQILQDYEATFGAGHPKSIITRKKGKHSHEPDIVHTTRMLPSIKKYYQVQELTLYNVITTVIKEYRSSFNSTDLHNLARINRDFSKMIPNTTRWLWLDFSPLRKPRYHYKGQTRYHLDKLKWLQQP
jgi:hypothetical protein